MTHLVGNYSLHLVVLGILKPHLNELLLGPQRQAHANDTGLTKLLANQRQKQCLPHQVYLVVLPDLGDPYSAFRTLLPHGHLTILKQENIDVPGHILHLFHEEVIALEVL